MELVIRETDRPHRTGRNFTDDDPLKQHLIELFKAVADICDDQWLTAAEREERLDGAYQEFMATPEGLQLYTDLVGEMS